MTTRKSFLSAQSTSERCGKTRVRLGLLLVFSLGLGWAASAGAADWPQWRGPNRDGISQETGWRKSWPAEGPKRLWEAKVGVGYSSYAVAGGRLFTMGNNNDVDSVYCLDAETGKLVWEHKYPCIAKDPNGYHGTRATPTVNDGRVYTVSRAGDFFCLDAATGKVIWSKHFQKEYGSKMPRWGFSGSPLIEKDWVLVEVGAPGASVVAFNKASGEEIWKNGDDGAAYSSLVAFDHLDQRCLAVFCADAIVGRRMVNGAELWRHKWKTSYDVNAATPIVQGDKVFVSSGYNKGCTLVQATSVGVKEVWTNKEMRNHVNSCVLWNGHLYGFDDDELKCLDFKTGEVKWSDKGYGKGSLMLADGVLILWGDRGKLGLAEPTPAGFRELASVQVLGGKDTWAAPVLSNGRIYCRSLEDLVALDVR
jgi:outer membrane protein assembly factor BamB